MNTEHRRHFTVSPPVPGEQKHNPTTAWNCYLRELSKQKKFQEALTVYRNMLRSSFFPNTFTFPVLLKSCALLSLPLTGSQLHSHVIKTGSQPDPYTQSSLINMYSKSSLPHFARKVFDESPVNLTISYNAMISGYSSNSMIYEAVNLFRKMCCENRFSVNSVTMLGLVSGFMVPDQLRIGACLHACGFKFGFDSDMSVGNSFLTMYVKCGEVEYARQLFDEMPAKDLITWNAMISGYAQNGHARRVLEIYREMKKINGVNPDPVTLLGVLCSSANLGAQGIGREVEREIDRFGFRSNSFLMNALINMYARCGNLVRAREVFDCMDERSKSVVSWTAIIGGYGIHGEGETAVDLFDVMVRSGVRPDRTVFVSVLSACSH
ncbi:pentatricopeptide (PPR) repeat protein, partial [Trifolium pratense]